MIAAGLRVVPDAVENVLDELLPLLPMGVHERPGSDVTELIACGLPGELPDEHALRVAAGRALRRLRWFEVPDDAAERRTTLHEPRIVGGRFHLRPAWAPSCDEPGLVEIVLEHVGFGTGSHPTTRMCLELIDSLNPGGSFADLGCGSGVLAIAAAKIGFHAVVAVDLDDQITAAVAASAAVNGVDVETRTLDLAHDPPPQCATFAANVPLAVHEQLAAQLPSPPPTAIISGIETAEVKPALACYAAAGLRPSVRHEDSGWAALLLEAR